ncbi:MAG: Type 1 glutamine amidotransferase-like domain-containing protein [Bdellovibrionales bacterium]|nr:Type 1 glutamine amidotransferase-like domain-containing protein [Bdellovibrionales bacterium]
MRKKNKVKLVLYSGGQERSNHRIHKALVELMGDKKRKTMTYIPFCSEGAKVYFGRFKRRYKAFGVTDFHLFPVDGPIDQDFLKTILKSDAIYLAGGNTFYFLHHLKKSGMLKILREYAINGGILVGLSAGAIMMTPNIEMAAFPPFDPDENEVHLKKLKALDLVGFEFFPHYVNSKRNQEAMMMYSLISPNPVFGCKDGTGIIVDGDRTMLLGSVYMFFQGKRLRLSHV